MKAEIVGDKLEFKEIEYISIAIGNDCYNICKHPSEESLLITKNNSNQSDLKITPCDSNSIIIK